MFSCVSFNTCIDSCKHYHSQKKDNPLSRKILLMLLLCNLTLYLPLIPGLLSDSKFLSFPKCLINGILYYGTFWEWLFTVMHLRFIQVIVCFNSSFLFLLLLIYSPIEEHLDRLWLFFALLLIDHCKKIIYSFLCGYNSHFCKVKTPEWDDWVIL